MQFTIGDKCQITRDGKQYTGDIVSGLTNSIVNVSWVWSSWNGTYSWITMNNYNCEIIKFIK